MKYPTLRFVFDRKHLATKERKGLVQLEVSFGGKRKWLGTSVKLYAGQWDDRKKVVASVDSVQLNATLDAQMASLNGFIADLAKNNVEFDFFRMERFLESSKSKSFIEFVRNRIEERNDIAESTRKQHLTLLKVMEGFGKLDYVDDLTRVNIMMFDDELHKMNITQTTIYNYHKRLKRYINEAVKYELVKVNPYHTLSFPRGKHEKRKYLTEEELGRIGECDIRTKCVERVRDLFLFQCYTGLAYGDLAKFDFKSGVEERNGKFVIADRRKKTNEDYFIVLLSPALTVLRKYDYVLPVISNIKYNLYLKVVAQYAGIDKNITTHVARHTFAVFALNNGVPIEVVAKMLGHTNIRTTQLYAKVLSSEVERGFELLESKVNK